VDVDDIQIEAWLKNGVSVALSNRRFAAIVQAGKLPTNVVYREPRPKEEARLNEESVLGEKLPSQSVAVTPGMKSEEILDTISLDNISEAEIESAAQARAAESEAVGLAQAQANMAAEEAEMEAESDAAEW
jgi:hypothetical protein